MKFIFKLYLFIILQGTTKPQGSASSWSSFTNGLNNNNNPQALEDLLERQWEQGGAFLMEQAQHFDSMIL